MENLYLKYKKYKGKDAFLLFSIFFSIEDLSQINTWMNHKLATHSFKKCNKKSNELRKSGNDFYSKKQYRKSINAYTKSLSYATFNSSEYGMALANRSAAAIILKDYLNCLNDINSCLKSEYPEQMRPKLYYRKAECCFNLNMEQELQAMIEKIKSTNNLEIIDKLKNFDDLSAKKKCYSLKIVPPKLSNENFLYAATKIRLQYNEEYGRHVVANEDINIGDVLFVEPAFAFAPIFENSSELIKDKCYNCLKDCKYSIPCKSCVTCFYCDEKCRDASWKNGHNFECAGMMLWYDLGIAFPAFKCMLKGVRSGFENYTQELKKCSLKFGDNEDNYLYFNSLESNISKMDNVTPLIVLAAAVVLYLKNKTNFFDWLIAQPKFENKIESDMMNVIGGVIVKHIAQLSCNSSIIQHWKIFSELNENTLVLNENFDAEKLIDLYESECVACGIFPSISMMNHSCKSNISIYALNDCIIAKATEPIKKNHQIFNNYGIDWKNKNKSERQNSLLAQYYFKCTCYICSHPEEEYEYKYNSYICSKCNNETNMEHNNRMKCLKEELLQSIKNITSVQALEKLLPKLQLNFNIYHDCMYEYYNKLTILHESDGNTAAFIKSMKKVLEIVEETHGAYSRKFALFLKSSSWEEEINTRSKNILKLYYPFEEINIIQR